MHATAAVTPRWEWRTFGASFPDVEARLAAGLQPPTASREIYIVSRQSDVNVKVRKGLLDVKRLVRVEDGLELWSPILKATFPIDAAMLQALFGYWAITPSSPPPDTCTLDQLLALARPIPQLIVSHVEKSRRRMEIDGCQVEMASLHIDGEPVETVSAEAEDPRLVRRTVTALHLSGFDNVNYVTALKRLAGSQQRTPPGRVREVASP